MPDIFWGQSVDKMKYKFTFIVILQYVIKSAEFLHQEKSWLGG